MKNNQKFVSENNRASVALANYVKRKKLKLSTKSIDRVRDISFLRTEKSHNANRTRGADFNFLVWKEETLLVRSISFHLESREEFNLGKTREHKSDS